MVELHEVIHIELVCLIDARDDRGRNTDFQFSFSIDFRCAHWAARRLFRVCYDIFNVLLDMVRCIATEEHVDIECILA